MTIAVLDGTIIENVSFEGADLRGSIFVNARNFIANFKGANLAGAVFEGAVLLDSDLTLGRLCKTQMPNDDMANGNCRND